MRVMSLERDLYSLYSFGHGSVRLSHAERRDVFRWMPFALVSDGAGFATGKGPSRKDFITQRDRPPGIFRLRITVTAT